MSRIKIVAHRNGWRRLLVLLLIGMALVILAITTQRWTDYTRPMPAAPVSYHVGIILVSFLILPCLLIALSWSEQRWWYAGLEALAVWLGMFVASAAFGMALMHIKSLVDVLAPCLAMLAIYLPARYLGLAFVRICLFSIVYGQGLCTTCGYDLTGNTSGICPECGIRVCGKTMSIAP